MNWYLALQKYIELTAAVWGCPIDELDAPDITHESTIKEVERQIKAEVESEEEIKRLKKELEEALKEVDELQTTIDSMSCLHSSPAYDPQTADEALNWINEDRGYGSWSSTDSRRFVDAVELVRNEIEKLRNENADLSNKLSDTFGFFEDVKNCARDRNPKGKRFSSYCSIVLRWCSTMGILKRKMAINRKRIS